MADSVRWGHREILFEPRTSADGSSEGLCYSPIPPQQTVKGKWLMKPSRFEKATIQFNARWKLRAEEGRHIFRGDVTAEPVVGKGSVPNARISGEILRDFANEDYRKVNPAEKKPVRGAAVAGSALMHAALAGWHF